MSTISTAFALTVNPVYFNLRDVSAKRELTWSRTSRKLRLYMGSGAQTDCATEQEAWETAIAHYPSLLHELAGSDMLSRRAYALRGEMMLRLGEERFNSLRDAVYEDVFRIYEIAMEVLDATKMTKAKPKATRVAQAKTVSWLEVRSRIRTPYHENPVLFSVRCLPSHLDDKTFSVRLRVPMTTDSAIREIQTRFEELVARLGYIGITVKDVQNGTCFDI